jgi:chemotaxis-related protein WspD
MIKTLDDIEVKITDCWNTIGVWSKGIHSCEKLKKVIHCRNCEIYSAAGRKMLERDLPEGYEDNWAKIISTEKKTQLIGIESVTIFRLGNEWMALPTKSIEEITDVCSVHSIPHRTSPVLRGLVNLRGQLKVCISLGQLMEIGKAEKYSGKETKERIYERMIAVTHNDSQYVFLVSEVSGTFHYHPKELKSTPATLSQAAGTYTQGILIWEDKDVACLDSELLFYSMEKKLA